MSNLTSESYLFAPFGSHYYCFFTLDMLLTLVPASSDNLPAYMIIFLKV